MKQTIEQPRKKYARTKPSAVLRGIRLPKHLDDMLLMLKAAQGRSLSRILIDCVEEGLTLQRIELHLRRSAIRNAALYQTESEFLLAMSAGAGRPSKPSIVLTTAATLEAAAHTTAVDLYLGWMHTPRDQRDGRLERILELEAWAWPHQVEQRKLFDTDAAEKTA